MVANAASCDCHTCLNDVISSTNFASRFDVLCYMFIEVMCMTLLKGWQRHQSWLTESFAWFNIVIPPAQRSCWGVYWFHSVRPSVCPSVRPSVRPSRMPCPLCIIYSNGWILFILGTNDHYHERVCCAPWPLTLTYIFKVIRPWLRKSCPLCSVYSSGWILSIFGTNDHYH